MINESNGGVHRIHRDLTKVHNRYNRSQRCSVEYSIIQIEILDREDNDYDVSSDTDSNDQIQMQSDKLNYNDIYESDSVLMPCLIDLARLKRRILVVDDEPFNVVSLLVLISSFKIRGLTSLIDRAYNGQEGLVKAR